MAYRVTNYSANARIVFHGGGGTSVPVGKFADIDMTEAEAENAKADDVTVSLVDSSGEIDLAGLDLAALIAVAVDEGVIPSLKQMRDGLTQAILAKREEGDDDLSQLDHDDDGNPGGSKPHEPPALSGKTKAELIEIAVAEAVPADDSMTVAEIKTAIEAKRADFQHA